MTPEQTAYMQAVTLFINDVVPVVGVLASALLGYALGRLPGVIR